MVVVALLTDATHFCGAKMGHAGPRHQERELAWAPGDSGEGRGISGTANSTSNHTSTAATTAAATSRMSHQSRMGAAYRHHTGNSEYRLAATAPLAVPRPLEYSAQSGRCATPPPVQLPGEYVSNRFSGFRA
jgi:hypothetical protein